GISVIRHIRPDIIPVTALPDQVKIRIAGNQAACFPNGVFPGNMRIKKRILASRFPWQAFFYRRTAQRRKRIVLSSYKTAAFNLGRGNRRLSFLS
ncbi:MAG: hypothetical protein PHC52_13870, partial [Syntrophales bacterium]|nr:hypothetical protein [Syntrophales bacterium]